MYDIQTESGEYLSSSGLRVHNCFILSVDDTMDSILNWYREEGVIFKGGSGSGINLSKIRSSAELLNGGGTASGPVSFMRGADASAGTIKSGGKTRRAAKMVILDVDHPDVEEFIWCKVKEERKARVLRDNGFDMDLDGSDSFSIQYQNANNSVRVTDEFMPAVAEDADWGLVAVTTGEVLRTVKARDLGGRSPRRRGSAPTPACSSTRRSTAGTRPTRPGGSTARTRARSTCTSTTALAIWRRSTCCNYLDDDGNFDVDAFRHTVEIVFTAQEILVGRADYPTPSIAETSRDFRQLGLGYANLGAMLMALGLPYDSADGRAWAARHHVADDRPRLRHQRPHGEPDGPVRRVRRQRGAHAAGAAHAPRRQLRDRRRRCAVPAELLAAGQESWEAAVRDGEEHGVRNSQASVLAPTGTIGLMMDCDTTGIEPDLGLVKMKKLVGGGTMSIVNQTIPRALRRLGYAPAADRRRSSPTSTPRSRSSARPTSIPSTCRCSPARWATTRSTTRVTCG